MIIYHGSEKKIEKPVFGFGSSTNDYGQDSTAQRILNWRKSGHVKMREEDSLMFTALIRML